MTELIPSGVVHCPVNRYSGTGLLDSYPIPVSRHPDCPFCNLSADRVLMETATTIAFLDGYPIAEGHTLVIPRRHVASVFDLTEHDQQQLWRQVASVRQLLAQRYRLDGFNIGVNDGGAAGQTVPHAHVHVIPRRKGDVPDPRGGVRWIMPGRARYW